METSQITTTTNDTALKRSNKTLTDSEEEDEIKVINKPKLPCFKLEPALPSFPYVNYEYSTNIALISNSYPTVNSNFDIPLTLKLYYSDNNEEIKDINNFLDVIPNIKNLSINNTFTMGIKLKFKQLSRNCGNRSFTIQIVPKNNNHEKLIGNVEMFNSNPLWIMTYALYITSKLEPMWYKDEGGRDNWLRCTGHLRDSSNSFVKNKEFLLDTTLVYENSLEPVEDRRLLKINPSSVAAVDASGHFDFKFRIEDVSKNHKKSKFVLALKPANAPVYSDVAFAYSNGVHVKSKRNKRPKKNGEQQSQSQNTNDSAADLLIAIRKKEAAANSEPELDISATHFDSLYHPFVGHNLIQEYSDWISEFEKKMQDVNKLVSAYKTNIEPHLGQLMQFLRTNVLIPPTTSRAPSMKENEEAHTLTNPASFDVSKIPLYPSYNPSFSRLFSSHYKFPNIPEQPADFANSKTVNPFASTSPK